MARRRPVALAAALVAVLGLAGCYGSTEPATDVETQAAVLHGQGRTNNGPAQSYFEYWRTSDPANRTATPKQDWPGGVSGPFSQRVPGLQQGTKYTFRMCGNDQGKPAVCAQQRTFETQTPDRAVGSGTNSTGTVNVDASSGPSGERAAGTVSFIGGGSPPSVFSGTVGCLEVHGNTAIVGFTGRGFVGGTPGPLVTMYGRIVDPGTGQDTFDSQQGELTSDPDCDLYQPGGSLFTGDFTVTDAQPPEPST